MLEFKPWCTQRLIVHCHTSQKDFASQMSNFSAFWETAWNDFGFFLQKWVLRYQHWEWGVDLVLLGHVQVYFLVWFQFEGIEYSVEFDFVSPKSPKHQWKMTSTNHNVIAEESGFLYQVAQYSCPFWRRLSTPLHCFGNLEVKVKTGHVVNSWMSVQ